MALNTSRSKELYAKACTLMPGGVNSPVRAFRSVGGHPLYFKLGKGSHIIDEDGNDFIDYCMSWGPLILGHADNDVVKAIQQVTENGTSFGAPHEGEIRIAELVKEAFPSIEKVRFVNSGTEATMSAIRLARGFTGKNKIIKFDGCYHGHADYLLVAAGSGLATFGMPDSAGVTKDAAKDTIVVKYNDIDALQQVLSHNDDIACCIMEPVCCNYGLILPQDDYLKKVRELCTKHKVLLIFDEVITGFRLARGGAQERFGVQADITTLGKIIGGGLPVGAYGGKAEIMANVAPDGPVYQAGTLSGNPIAVAAGIATLQKLMPLAYQKLEELGNYFEEQMKAVVSQYRGKLLFVRYASIFALYFTQESKITTVEQVKECNMQQFAQFHRAMLERGVYLSPSGYEVGFLSLSHSKNDIDTTVKAIDESLRIVLG
ncbi:MAG: glutamate-1-semialdehyde 2,1-aminomutase [Spirochaetes bacterium]|nr:glutamate-1-semialdehyde 2,1-aminomutase [Spirochaetota bacterium]